MMTASPRTPCIGPPFFFKASPAGSAETPFPSECPQKTGYSRSGTVCSKASGGGAPRWGRNRDGMRAETPGRRSAFSGSGLCLFGSEAGLLSNKKRHFPQEEHAVSVDFFPSPLQRLGGRRRVPRDGIGRENRGTAPPSSERFPLPSPIQASYSSGGSSLSCLLEKTGPSRQTSLPPMLQRPQMPMPHFMRFSSVVYI